MVDHARRVGACRRLVRLAIGATPDSYARAENRGENRSSGLFHRRPGPIWIFNETPNWCSNRGLGRLSLAAGASVARIREDGSTGCVGPSQGYAVCLVL